MGVTCQILIDRPEDGAFKAGRLVTGTLKYFIDKPTKYERISMCFLGKGDCEWTETDAKNTLYYQNKEKYINQIVNVYVRRKSEDFISGGFEYPIQFLLPIDIPPSFYDKICTIEYKIIVTFAKANSFSKKNFDVRIPVTSYVNPCTLEPITFGLKKNLSFRINNKINVKGEISKTCIKPGDTIHMTLTVNNGTDLAVVIKTELIKRLTYISKGNHKKYHEEAVKNTCTISTVAANAVANLVCLASTYQDLFSIQHAKVMKGEYMIRLKAKLPFPHANALLDIPVVIGQRKHELIAPPAVYYEYNREQPSTSAMLDQNNKYRNEEDLTKYEKEDLNEDSAKYIKEVNGKGIVQEEI
ncbi:hypothetical protein HW555_001447 [Spodoptera exigua]|uniref:Arrestin C-terminal-like domain-containing protein n=1 Tax=Spodoptera exigua TaxID=7107 RepID=A0A835GQK4_SPOEX|nr:hypothetical protein HW555_001447 [Spodoptera exigua]